LDLRKAALAILALLALPAAAHAATKTVVAGPYKPVKGVFGGNATGDVDGFSLRTVTIHVGDKVRWKFNGLHNVVFPAPKGSPPPFTVADPSAKVSGSTDPAGAPFWFNGQPQLDFNLQAILPQGGSTYKGSALTGNGVSPTLNQKPYTLKFTKTGTFSYYCSIHPGMKARVKVVARGTKVPTARDDAKTAAKLLAAETKTAKQAARYKPPTGVVAGGNDKGDVVQLRFFPQTIDAKAGTPLTFKVTSLREAHTFSFGPAAFLQQTASNLLGAAPNGALQFSPVVYYPSDPFPLPAYDGSAHGNGYFSTGQLDGDPSTSAPSTAKVTFSKPGTYTYICLIHPFMQGKVVVTS
jgi:plastocyanin